MNDSSPKYQLNKTDLLSIARGAAIAAGGVLVAYFADVVTHFDNSTLGGALIASVGSILLNLGRKYLTNHSTEK